MRARNQGQRNVTSPDLHAQAKGPDDCLVSVAIKVARLLHMRTGGLEALESKWKKEKLARSKRNAQHAPAFEVEVLSPFVQKFLTEIEDLFSAYIDADDRDAYIKTHMWKANAGGYKLDMLGAVFAAGSNMLMTLRKDRGTQPDLLDGTRATKTGDGSAPSDGFTRVPLYYADYVPTISPNYLSNLVNDISGQYGCPTTNGKMIPFGTDTPTPFCSTSPVGSDNSFGIMAGAAIFGMFVYGIIVPCLLFVGIRNAASRSLQDPEVQQRYGWMTLKYKPRCWFFEFRMGQLGCHLFWWWDCGCVAAVEDPRHHYLWPAHAGCRISSICLKRCYIPPAREPCSVTRHVRNRCSVPYQN